MSETGSNSYEIDQMLTISSIHISKDTQKLLDEAVKELSDLAIDDNDMPPVHEKLGYGWFIACDPDTDNEALGETWNDYPVDLVAAMRLAKEQGCFWLCIDCDGPEVDGLEKFE